MKHISTPKTFLLLFLLTALGANAQHTYYVSPSGSDANDGLSPAPTHAWATTTKVNSFDFLAGDSILFEGGQVFSGFIDQEGGNSGTSVNPIVFSSYGTGMATIDAGAAATGMFFSNKGGIVVRKLIVTSTSGTNNVQGIFFFTDSSANIDYLVVDSVEVSGFGGSGIIIGTESATAGYTNVRVTHSSSHNNGVAGISSYSLNNAILSSNFYVGYCKSYNNFGNPTVAGQSTGNGIVLGGVDGGTIEFSEAYNNGQNNTFNNGGPVGIWTYNSKNIIIQFCESHHNKAGDITDGGGFDLDGGTQNCFIQYCYSHDNEGAGYALFNFSTPNPYTNNVIRYNISQNDGRKNSYGGISIWGQDAAHPITNSSVYNNTFYVNNSSITNGTPAGAFLVGDNTNKVNATNITVENNIFYVTAGVNMVTSPDATVTTASVNFTHNDYFSSGTPNYIWGGTSYNSLATWGAATGEEANGTTGTEANPTLKNPGAGGTVNPADGGNLASVTGYALFPGSPMIDAGLTPPGTNTHDYYGTAVPQGAAFDIGANEFSASVILPVTIISFSGAIANDHSILKWKVANEENLSGYDVQKSADGVSFKTIGTISAAGSADYNYTDVNFQGTVQYYRLRLLNRNGAFTYSNILKLQRSVVTKATASYQDGYGLVIRLNSSNEQWSDIRIYDASGRNVLVTKRRIEKGDNVLTFTEASQWTKGLYIVHINLTEEQVLKFIK